MRCRGCLQVIVKLLNLLLFVIGVAMILYSVWMLKEFKHRGDGMDLDFSQTNSKWQRVGRPFILSMDSSKLHAEFSLPAPWFIYAFMAVGIIVCLVTFSGYVAAEAASACCLCCSSVCLGILLLLQVALAATIFFDNKWEKDFPKDPTGQIHKIRHFVEANVDFCKWIALSVIVLEGLSLLFGMILRALIGDFRRAGYDSDDDDYSPAPRASFRQSLASRQNTQGGPSTAPDPRNDSAWSTRLRDKYTPSESRRLLQNNPAPEENRSRCTIM